MSINPIPRPTPPDFNPVNVETVRQIGEIFDTYYGNNDGALSARESGFASQILRYYSPNVSNAFQALSYGIDQKLANIDPNGDGKMTLDDEVIPPGTQTFAAPRLAELTLLAQKSGEATLLEKSDFGFPSPPSPPPFNPVPINTVGYASWMFDQYAGNADGKLEANEANRASTYLKTFSPNLGKLFAKISEALMAKNPNVDKNGDGKLSYLQDYQPNSTTNELVQLAKRSGNPYLVENSDFADIVIQVDAPVNETGS